MTSVDGFEDTKLELIQEDNQLDKKTLCFDIENIFIRKINIRDQEELNILKDIPDSQYEDYIHNCQEKYYKQ